MYFFFKDRKTFVTKAVCEGISYRLVESVWTDLSEITCTNSDAVKGDEFIYTEDGWIAVLTSVEHDEGSMTVKAEKIESLYSRQLRWNGFGRLQPAEWTVAVFLRSHYMECPDDRYNIPFLTYTRETLEAPASCPQSEEGLITEAAVIAQARRLANVFTYHKVEQDILHVYIRHEIREQKTLITTNLPCQIVEESFSKDKRTAKVSTYTLYDGFPPYFEDITDWYLYTDGTIGNDPDTKEREEGLWVQQDLKQEDDPETVVRNIFNKNNYTHKVVIRLPDDRAIYNFYDPVRVEVNNHLYNTYVSRKIRTSDGYTEYTFGDLKTSLMDKINEEE